MSVKKVVEKDTWFIAHNQAKVLFVRVGKPSVVHYGFCLAGTELDSGQPIIDSYYNEEDWLLQLAKWDIIPDPPIEDELI
jgi:hypothetical protein